jgi:hypothetical protein
MNSNIIENRIKFACLIYSMDTFTEKELVDQFEQGQASSYLGSFQSINDYLWDLKQFGTLSYDQGVYKVAEFGQNRY